MEYHPIFSTSHVHFTTFVGMVHNSNTYLWKDAAKASAGTESVAEIWKYYSSCQQ